MLALLYFAVATPALTLEKSIALAQSAIRHCAIRGQSVAASVVDAKGIDIVVLRGDGLEKLPSAASRKAATAVAFGAAGSEMEQRVKTDPLFAATIAARRDIYNPDGGSLPLKKDQTIIGGIAVAYTSHELADLCVRAAVKEHPL